jgi:hypothetical protein
MKRKNVSKTHEEGEQIKQRPTRTGRKRKEEI